MIKRLLFPALMLIAGAACAQKSVISGYYPVLRSQFNEDNAYKTVGFVESRWRWPGNKGYNESIYYVENLMKQAGFIKQTKGDDDGPLTYRLETRDMRGPTWDPISATVQIEGDSKPLETFATNFNMIAQFSGSTPAGGVTAEVVYLTRQEMATATPEKLKGKIVFAEAAVGQVYSVAAKNGALGAFGYSLPAYTKPEKNVNSIQFSRVQNQDSTSQVFGILLSYQAKERLKAALAKGPVKVHVETQSKIYHAKELTVIANVRGTVNPFERFVFSAHVQEPGANDNATGVGTLAEMARVTANLVKSGKFDPKRTITFIFGNEIEQTRNYIADDPARAKGIKWGMSLDMTGEDVTKTGGTFLIEKMPDPSAIWTRGNDHHTEWGGRPLKESDMFPHYYNDLVLDRCREQAKATGWVVNANPFEGGSDHTPFLTAKIPGVLMWHFTDQFYHTDGDRLNMVSAKEMKNVGVSALATAFTLTCANQATTLDLVQEIQKNATDRLNTEYALSQEEVKKGGKIDEQKHILDVWTKWYVDAIGKMTDIKVGGTDAKIDAQIASSQKVLTDLNVKLDANLK